MKTKKFVFSKNFLPFSTTNFQIVVARQIPFNQFCMKMDLRLATCSSACLSVVDVVSVYLLQVISNPFLLIF